MAPALVIGYGNPLRGDDGVAWHLAAQLRQSSADLEVVTCHQLTPELAETVRHAALVIFLDAEAGQTPGELKFRPVAAEPSAVLFSHQFTPGLLLHMAAQLYGEVPASFLVTVVGECFDLGEELSPPVKRAIPDLVKLVGRIVQSPSDARSLTAQLA